MMTDSSLELHGPMTALQVLRLFSKHIREEVSRNYVLSETLRENVCESLPSRAGTESESW